MSDCSWIEWFESLLFGSETLLSSSRRPPVALYKIILRLESEGIHWRDVVQHGGLTMFRYHINGDLDVLMDYLDKCLEAPDPLPVFKTRIVTTFFNHLLTFLARRPVEPVLEQDQVILEKILAGESGHFRYVSAAFWGDLARGWVSLRRPLPDCLRVAGTNRHDDKVARLYDITCKARGDKLDPMSMVMIPASEHVSSVHWQSSTLLESFVLLRPNHALSRTVRQLVREAVHQLLEGRHPTLLVEKDETISTFLQNVSCLDEHVRKVSLVRTPPLVIDVFQRLLALVQLDDLWTTTHGPSCSTRPFPKTEVMLLTEQLLLADRQNKILLHHISD